MKFLIVSTTLLALATAAVLPSQKFVSQNGMIEENDGHTRFNYEQTRELEERESIPSSFDDIVNNIRLNGRYLTENEGLTKDEISIPDTVNVGSVSDTLFSNIRVKGMKRFASQNMTMLWGENVVNVESSWKELIVDGVYHYTNAVGRFAGAFRIVMADPKYAGNTSLTKNSNTYPTMSIASSVTFGKAFINHTKLPELFQNEKPEFEYLIKNVVCPHVANAVAENMYNEVSMSIRQAVQPYLTYQSNKIATDATSFNGLLDNGDRFEFDNIHFVNTQNNVAKISFVQINNTKEATTVKLQLRLLSLTGESNCVLYMDGKSYSGKVIFKIEPVLIVPSLNINDKKVQTEVLMKNTRILFKIQEQNTIDLTYAKEQLTKQLVTYFVEQIAKNTNQSIKNAM